MMPDLIKKAREAASLQTYAAESFEKSRKSGTIALYDAGSLKKAREAAP